MELGRTSRRLTSEYPKPDAGLAEWTSKIRAMQRQVDADEEAEQKRLEEEIAASRLARQRRSRGYGSNLDNINLDHPKSQGYRSHASIMGSLEEVSSRNGPEPVDRQMHTQETLLKLTSSVSSNKQPPLSSDIRKGGEMSLAAFMGGRADGPRLNRHAPQQDAHDPTQFEQRTRIDAPHPVFGKGGVAMPGLVGQGKVSASAVPAAALEVGELRSFPVRSSEKGNDAEEFAPITYKRASPSTTTSASQTSSRSPPIASTTSMTRYPSLPPDTKKGEISLANFMGGRADGPRLNKHAPQQDAHDPTQFDQRTHIDAPHPVFGKGGVAMPGMAGKGGVFPSALPSATRSADDLRESPSFPKRRTTAGRQRESESVTPPVIKRYDSAQSPGVTPQDTGKRERTVSTPTGSSPHRSPTHTGAQDGYRSLEKPRRPVSQSSVSAKTYDIRPKTPESRSKTPENRTNTPQVQPLPNRTKTPPPSSSSGSAATALFTPRQQSWQSSSAPPSARKSSITTSSLARPIRPEPKMPPQAPQIPSQSPSPAFMRSATQKEPTPSLSRLQGRGFVQSMVKVSSQMESVATGGSPSNGKMRQTSPRKSSVLDRWSVPMASTNTASPPASPKYPISIPSRTAAAPPVPQVFPSPASSNMPKPAQNRKSLEMVSAPPAVSVPEEVQPPPGRQPLKKRSIPNIMPPEGSPGLGSSSTMISFVKPNKTGDDPFPASGAPPADVDELGVRTNVSEGVGKVGKVTTVSELPASSGKPLSHPTRDRPRKLRKARDSKGSVQTDSRGSTATPPTEGLSTYSPSRSPALSEKPFAGPSPLAADKPRTTTLATDVVTGQGERPLRVSQQPSQADDRQSKVGNVVDRWGDLPPSTWIKPAGLKSVPSYEDSRAVPLRSISSGLVGRQALPGLAKSKPESTERQDGPLGRFHSQDHQSRQEERKSVVESNGVAERHPVRISVMTNAVPGQDASRLESDPVLVAGFNSQPESTTPAGARAVSPQEDRSPVLPARHSRIPSSGNRATVMDIAQAFHSQSPPISPGWIEHRAEFSGGEVPQADIVITPPEAVPLPVVNYRNSAVTAAQAEKRKSNYEKYSAIMMPPLKEERTPAPTPSTSLSRSTAPPLRQGSMEAFTEVERTQLHEEHIPPPILTKPIAPPDLVHFNHYDRDTLDVDVGALTKSRMCSYTPDEQTATVSVDVMAIVNGAATAITRDIDIFYDTEILAIIHRFKDKSTGLVSTTVWGWRGKRSVVGERDERKLNELAKRYGTVLKTVRQYAESPELVHLLGGRLAMRQGTRAHWTPENTTIHVVRKLHGVIYIDEYDFHIKNLCSGFSYCLSVLDTLYVWHGRGSLTEERYASAAYARSLATTGTTITELVDGENDNNEMFWLILGNEEYANADYWQWRRDAAEIDPCIWKVQAGKAEEAVVLVPSLSSKTGVQTSVYVLDCVWEFFVFVGKEARGKREDIRLALSVATKLSTRVAMSRPYNPNVHVLVLPSQLPLDLRLNFRGLDEFELNNGNVPNHMNILSSPDALEHLRKASWERKVLRDHTMLPLGLDSSDL